MLLLESLTAAYFYLNNFLVDFLANHWDILMGPASCCLALIALLICQTQSLIYQYCAQSAIAHLTGTDILTFTGLDNNPPSTDKMKPTPPFLKSITNAHQCFLIFIMNINTNIPLISTIPAKHGGLGYRDTH